MDVNEHYLRNYPILYLRQIKSAGTMLLLLFFHFRHSSVFDNEQNTYPKMSVKWPPSQQLS